MADKTDKPADKSSKSISAKLPKKKQLTVRERAAAANEDKPKRIRKAAGRVRSPFGKAKKVGKKEYNVPLPDNKAGRVLKKRVRIVPKFVREAFAEIKLVTWPDTKTTIRLTIAVFLFAMILALTVGALDYVLGEIFKELFVKNQ